MLRISIQDGAEALTIKLEGKVIARYADELFRTWQALANRLSDKKFRVDLCGVTDADAEGRQLLADIHKETGAVFLTDTPLAAYLAQEASR